MNQFFDKGIFEALLNGILWIISQFYALLIKICNNCNSDDSTCTVDLSCYAIVYLIIAMNHCRNVIIITVLCL